VALYTQVCDIPVAAAGQSGILYCPVAGRRGACTLVPAGSRGAQGAGLALVPAGNMWMQAAGLALVQVVLKPGQPVVVFRIVRKTFSLRLLVIRSENNTFCHPSNRMVMLIQLLIHYNTHTIYMQHIFSFFAEYIRLNNVFFRKKRLCLPKIVSSVGLIFIAHYFIIGWC